MTSSRGRTVWLVAVVAALIGGLVLLGLRTRSKSYAAQNHDPWTADQVMTPEALAKEISRPQSERAAVVYVGFDFFYTTAHVPGALYLGPGREAQGIEALTKWAHGVPRDKQVVLYCGCCPWTQCPNIRPAYHALHDMGFKHLKVVEMDQDFAHDWVAKGYPVEKGSGGGK